MGELDDAIAVLAWFMVAYSYQSKADQTAE